MEYQPMEVAALGRPLYPGMLYDGRNDSFIPGVTLWNKKALTEDVDVRQKPRTDLKFSASDSLSDKTSLLDVSASLKASFLGGLVEVEGSAKYLHDTKSSALQSRVTMYYSQTTRFEQLTMAELGNITYPQVFDQQSATHVVTAVLFGAQALMVFDQTSSNTEDTQKIEGKLRVMVKSLPSFSIDGEGGVKMSEEDKKTAKNINVTFHGDYELESNPTTYMEALKVYQTLPSLLKDKENHAVPLRVWLYPLHLLNDKAAKLVREISANLVSKTEQVLEEMGDVERRFNDLLKSTTAQNFPDIKGRLQRFQTLYSNYKMEFQKNLQTSLPDIRKGEKHENELAMYLETYNKSPFNVDKLNQWLDNVTTELDIVTSYTKELDGIRVVISTGQLNTILFNPGFDAVVCFSFTSLKYDDTYLKELTDYLANIKGVTSEKIKSEMAHENSQTEQEPQLWFEYPENSKLMKHNLFLFKSFSKTNNNPRICSLIASVSDTENLGASIQLYENGKLKDSKYQPQFKPSPPTVEIQRETVTLTFQDFPYGVTEHFNVKYKIVDSSEKWNSLSTSDANKIFSFRLPGLKLRNKYLICYKTVSAFGESEASEPVCIYYESSNICKVVGGSGGEKWSSADSEDYRILRRIAISSSDAGVDAMEITSASNQTKIFGTAHSTLQEVRFEDGDYLQSLTLWPNSEGNQLGGIEFNILRSSGLTEPFSAKGSKLGSPVNIDVGSGMWGGIDVKHGSEIIALGFYFMKAVVVPYTSP